MYQGYVITGIKSDGSRQMALNNEGRNTHRTFEAAQAQLDNIIKNTDEKTIEQTLGKQLRIDPVQCYDHGDAVGTVFSTPKTLHVIEVTSNQGIVSLISHYNFQNKEIVAKEEAKMPVDNEPGSIQPALDTAQAYLIRKGYNIVGRCPGKLRGDNTVSYIISDTFKPFDEQ